MKKVIILAAIGLMGQSAHAQIREFQTTRLMGTAGAGVASILSTEAAILNPASSAFFQGNSASYQSYTTKLKDEHELRDTLPDNFAKRNRSQGIFVSDNNGPVKGGLAYLTQRENDFERSRITMHGAVPMGKKAAMGISYSYLQDKEPREIGNDHSVSHQVTIGTTHIIDEDTILGLVLIDPTRTTPGEERLLAGFQYTLADRITLIGDVGAQYTQTFSDHYVWRAAVQLNIFSDFFFRAGKFYDNVREEKGTGWGVSWIGPRLGVEFAQRMSEQFGRNGYIYRDESLIDTSLSAILKF